jgi:Ca2+-binding EF-hand superfamily protein
MLDANNDGFISRDEWGNIDKILPMQSQVKEALFRYMDRANLSMIDYKVFLELLEGGNESSIRHEKFDWVKVCIQSIRDWASRSGLLPADAFKVVDRDFDGYITDRDLNTFLCDTLKYQQK